MEAEIVVFHRVWMGSFHEKVTFIQTLQNGKLGRSVETWEEKGSRPNE